MPYEDGAVFDMRFPFSVNDVGIFVREDTVSVESELFNLTDTQDTSSGKTYYLYEQLEPLAPNAPFKFTILGEPIRTTRAGQSASSDSSNSPSSIFIVLIVGVVLLLIGITVWLFVARRNAQRTLLQSDGGDNA